MTEEIEFGQRSPYKSCVRDGDERVQSGLFCKECHLLMNTPVESIVSLTRRSNSSRILVNPCLCFLRKALFDLLPPKTFPLAEMDLAQTRPKMNWSIEVQCNHLGGLPRPLKVTRVDDLWHLGNCQGCNLDLTPPGAIERRIGVAAEATCHRGLAMPKQDTRLHRI